jgi:hypothetical protein
MKDIDRLLKNTLLTPFDFLIYEEVKNDTNR